MADQADWVTITTCQSIAEADLLASDLRAAGFEVLIPDEAVMQNAAWNLNTYGYLRVQVHAKDLTEARGLLRLDEVNPETETKDAEPGTDRTNIPLSWPLRFATLLFPVVCFMGLVIFALMRRNYLNRGFVRKAKELTRWFIASLVLWFLVVVVMSSISHKR
jgi:4-amino-4-deoxy-L-arabinose transferase-like glycosyltransferase